MSYKYDFIEYYAADINAIVDWHISKMGFSPVAVRKLDDELRSVLLKKNDIRILFTTPAPTQDDDVARFLEQHGEGIKRIALAVPHLETAIGNAMANGGMLVAPPVRMSDDQGMVRTAALRFFDDNELVFADYSAYDGVFMPGYAAVQSEDTPAETHLTGIDHIAYAIGESESDQWEDYFNRALNLKTVQSVGKDDDESIGMEMKVLQSEDKKITNVFSAPVNGGSVKSQIQMFVEEHQGNGIQHIAFGSDDIFETVKQLKARGVAFTPFPNSYYTLLKEKFPHLDTDRLKEHGLLCDVVDNSLLLQIFTLPVGNRPTLFYEIVQRVDNYEGFGISNIRTLFQAVQSTLQS